ncbi:MAG: right-handed parallel beta-helix repeat-containing protein, partial [Hasllibacter sp.]
MAALSISQIAALRGDAGAAPENVLLAARFGLRAGADAAANAVALQAACDAARGGTVVIAPGSYDLAATRGAAALVLGAVHRGITLEGRGGAVLRPASDRVELIAQDGADRVRIEGIAFANPHGALQGQAKTGNGAGAGLTGGNGANAAIRQYRGAGLTVRDCTFTGFDTAIHYIGDAGDDAVLSGRFVAEALTFEGCAFGMLIDAPEEIEIRGCRETGGLDSVNGDGSVDPGHMVYVTDRSGPEAASVRISDCHGAGRDSSPIKVRKGRTVSILGCTVLGCGRGIELSNVEGGGVIDGCHIRLGGGSATGNNSGIELTDCAYVTLGGETVIDVSGEDAWGVRVRSDLGGAGRNLGCVLGALTVVDDATASAGKAAVAVVDQADIEIDGPRLVHTGVSGKPAMIDLIGCARPTVRRPRFRAPGGASAAERVVRLRGATADAQVALHQQDCDAPVSRAGSVRDDGTATGALSRIDRLEPVAS